MGTQKKSNKLLHTLLISTFLAYIIKYVYLLTTLKNFSDAQSFSQSWYGKFDYTQFYDFIGLHVQTIDYFKYFPFDPFYLTAIIPFIVIPATLYRYTKDKTLVADMLLYSYCLFIPFELFFVIIDDFLVFPVVYKIVQSKKQHHLFALLPLTFFFDRGITLIILAMAIILQLNKIPIGKKFYRTFAYSSVIIARNKIFIYFLHKVNIPNLSNNITHVIQLPLPFYLLIFLITSSVSPLLLLVLIIPFSLQLYLFMIPFFAKTYTQNLLKLSIKKQETIRILLFVSCMYNLIFNIHYVIRTIV